MTAIMKGVRVLEVSEHGFLPMAGALLADWGAEVIKIEPVERGDAARGITTTGDDVNVLFEHANRGKQSLALDLAQSEAREILYRLAASADVFMTNKLPRVRAKLKLDVEDLRAHNPRLIYARGGGAGEKGPERDRGSYDLLSFWHRTGVSSMVARPDGSLPFLPAPGFGDFTGAMFIAGGVMGALFHRERTGEATVVDSSLLATGMWSMGAAIACADRDPAWPWPPPQANPLSATYYTADDRRIALCCLQAAHYWPMMCEAIGRPELGRDPRFATQDRLLGNAEAATILREAFAAHSLAEWRVKLETFPGQWNVVQTAAEVPSDPMVEPNGYLQRVETAAGVPFRLVAAPIQYDGVPARPGRAPEFNEHGDAILEGLGLDWDAVVDLKVRGIVG
ncbi:CaiB/BaiF CoA transferase family protein [Novosphingobium bradum]|uniref:CaiB/BaiF CoA transferase family protein n=1 Tax=Novosphingobium bradum TaxID=1737444 RepID=A0ABV7INB4_9SPHN